LTDCGASAESCCTSLKVPGGTYYRTYTNGGSGPTGQADPATVSGFRLDKYDVTVGRFRQFVHAWNGGAGWTPPAGSGRHTHLNAGEGLVDVGAPAGGGTVYETGWLTSDIGNVSPTDANLACDPNLATWTATAGSQENLPVNCVNWYEAYAFCIWDGGFLPSESEWEYAAAGGSEQLEYPWGTAAPGTSSQYAIYDCYYRGGGGTCPVLANIAPVGSAPAGAARWGQLDLVGEIWELNLDLHASYVTPCSDCAYLTGSTGDASNGGRVTRGGDFAAYPGVLVPPDRGGGTPPAFRYVYYGFRCARTP
jgi:formylglycine-generating enzyme required for sulfatase activity